MPGAVGKPVKVPVPFRIAVEVPIWMAKLTPNSARAGGASANNSNAFKTETRVRLLDLRFIKGAGFPFPKESATRRCKKSQSTAKFFIGTLETGTAYRLPDCCSRGRRSRREH